MTATLPEVSVAIPSAMRVITVPRDPTVAYKTWEEWGGSPFNHPHCPQDARYYVSFSRDPSFDKYVHVAYFGDAQEATEGRRLLQNARYCCSTAWKRHS